MQCLCLIHDRKEEASIPTYPLVVHVRVGCRMLPQQPRDALSEALEEEGECPLDLRACSHNPPAKCNKKIVLK